MGPNFGPEGNTSLDLGQTHTVWMPPGASVRFRFSFNAYNENATIVYAAETLDPVVYANNIYARREEWHARNRSQDTKGFVITGWHKDVRHHAAAWPWHQSRSKVFFADSAKASVGFEDIATGNDFDDALVTVNIIPPPKVNPYSAFYPADRTAAFLLGVLTGGIAGLVIQGTASRMLGGLQGRKP